MACFIVPGAEAVVTTIVTKIIENKERKYESAALKEGVELKEFNKERFSSKLKRLNGLLWGGSALLAFEHLWHGEIAPFFPFLTAVQNPADLSAMLHEMATVGVGMAVIVTAIWGAVTFVTDSIKKRETATDLNMNIQK